MPKRSLAEEIARLSNPEPEFRDPEELFDNETAAKVVDQESDNDDDDDFDTQVSSLRKKTVTLLSDHDKKYAGRTVSRRSLQGESGSESGQLDAGEHGELSDDDDDNDEDDDDDGGGGGGGDIIQDDDIEYTNNDDITKKGDSDDDDEDDDDVSPSKAEKFTFDGDFSRFDDEFAEEDDSEDESSAEGSDIGDGSSPDTGDESEENGDLTQDGAVQSFSKTDHNEEITKGKAVKDQIDIWDNLLEGRIRLQKTLVTANQLPQHDTFQDFLTNGGQEYQEANKKASRVLKKLLRSLAELQQALFLQNPETVHLVEGGTVQKDESDEEITSDESDNEEEERKPERSEVNRKRKLEITDYGDFLTKRHRDFQQYRNNTIQKWHDKTKLTSGKINSKSFSSFERSAVTQIQQILGDKDRLIKRSQLKRSTYRVLGKEEKTQTKEGDSDDEDKQHQQELLPKTDLHLKNYDEEIFDDDDFYHQLLRELIEKRTVNTSDPIALGRQWLKIQKLRSRVKKNVDTKASKGRKLRYDLHQKLVSFMAPVDLCTLQEESRTELYNSLFGKSMQTSVESER